jgi:hypothetical protein
MDTFTLSLKLDKYAIWFHHVSSFWFNWALKALPLHYEGIWTCSNVEDYHEFAKYNIKKRST